MKSTSRSSKTSKPPAAFPKRAQQKTRKGMQELDQQMSQQVQEHNERLRSLESLITENQKRTETQDGSHGRSHPTDTTDAAEDRGDAPRVCTWRNSKRTPTGSRDWPRRGPTDVWKNPKNQEHAQLNCRNLWEKQKSMPNHRMNKNEKKRACPTAKKTRNQKQAWRTYQQCGKKELNSNRCDIVTVAEANMRHAATKDCLTERPDGRKIKDVLGRIGTCCLILCGTLQAAKQTERRS